MRFGSGVTAALLFGAWAILSGQVPARKGAASTSEPARRTFAAVQTERITAVLSKLDSTGNFGEARKELTSLFDEVIAYSPDGEAVLMRDAAFSLRFVKQLSEADGKKQLELYRFLTKRPVLARMLAFMVSPDVDKVRGAYDVLDALRQADAGDRLEAFSNLAAALCVVYDEGQLKRHVNENLTSSEPPTVLYEYFTRYEGRMRFGMRDVPAELLIWVVDSTATAREMEWALLKYQGTTQVGNLFFKIDYDYDYLKRGKTKKVSVNGFNLPNLLEYGGVCADQAYFAAAVGKCIGVPTATAWAQSATAGHVWVGFFQAKARDGVWNFNSGRYQDYKDIKGEVINPQSRKTVPDAYVSLTAEMIGISREYRQTAQAYIDAARRVIELMDSGKGLEAAKPDESAVEKFLLAPRRVDVNVALDLLEAGLTYNPANAEGWLVVRDLAVKGRLTLGHKQRWGGVVGRFTRKKYPDFTLLVLAPMIKSVESPEAQDRMWSEALGMFHSRPDLCAEVLMNQARFREGKGEIAAAGQLYETIILKYANDGPFIMEALQAAERLLKDARPEIVAGFYEQAWRRIKRPHKIALTEITKFSNWYRVGSLYAVKLELAGEKGKAKKVKDELEDAIK